MTDEGSTINGFCGGGGGFDGGDPWDDYCVRCAAMKILQGFSAMRLYEEIKR